MILEVENIICYVMDGTCLDLSPYMLEKFKLNIKGLDKEKTQNE